MVAVLVPSAVGAKVIVNVVVLNAATVALGGVVTVNSEALVPVMVMAPMVKAKFPLLKIVNVLVPATVLKSVQLAVVAAVIVLSGIETPFPWISISGMIPNPWMLK